MRARHHSPLDPLLTAMGGVPAAAHRLRLASTTLHGWRVRGPSLHGAERLLAWAQHMKQPEVAAHLERHLAEKRRRHSALSYVAKCLAFDAGRWWPTFGITGKAEMPRKPEHPPADMRDDERERARLLLQRAGWDLRFANGRWVAVPTL